MLSCSLQFSCSLSMALDREAGAAKALERQTLLQNDSALSYPQQNLKKIFFLNSLN